MTAVFAHRRTTMMMIVASLLVALLVSLGLTLSPLGSRPAAAATSTVCQTLEPVTVKSGTKGSAAMKVQDCLTLLGFMPLGSDGVAGGNTGHAILAAQKYAGLGRDSVAGSQFRAWAAGASPVTMPAQCGNVTACVDKSRQIIFIKMDGGLKVVDTSTGSGEKYRTKSGKLATAVTPTGSATVCRKINGLRVSDLGQLYSPSYLDYDNDGKSCAQSGYAIHGSPSVPASPASHGCARVTRALEGKVFAALPVGSRVTIF